MYEVLTFDHLKESYWENWTVLSWGIGYYAGQGGSNFESVDEILRKSNKAIEYFKL